MTSPRSRRRWRAALLCAALPISLAACGTSSSGGGAAPVTSVTVATELAISSLDGLVTNHYEINHVIYAGLDRLGLTGKVEPDLASSWKANGDATQWTYQLRPNLKFSDGTPLTAKDVLFSFNSVHNNSAALENTYLTPMKSVTASGSTITFTLKQADAIWDRVVTWIPIVSEAAYKKEGAAKFASAPVGAGPYSVVSFDGVGKVKLTVNPHYWGTKPAIANVTMEYVEDPVTRLNGLQSGQFDAALLSGPSVQTAKSAGLTVTSIPSSKVIWLGYNFTSPSVSSLDLRRAVSAAIDRASLVKSLLNGLGAPIGQLVPPTTVGHDKSIAAPAYDVAAAKRLVAASGYKGETIPLNYPLGSFVPAAKNVAQAVASYLQAAGVKVELRATSQQTFLTDWVGKKLDGIYLMSIQNVLLDGGGNFQFLDTVANTFTDPTLTKTYDQSLAEVDPTKRDALLAELSAINNKNQYYTPLFSDEFNYVYSSKLKLTAPASGYLLPQYLSPAS